MNVSNVSTVVPVTNAAPTLSSALSRWLEQQGFSPRGESGESVTYVVNKVKDLAQIFDRANEAELAAQVVKGYCVACIQAIGPDDLKGFVRERDMQLTVAYRYLDLYRLFVELPDLKLIERAAALGISHIRELKPHLGIDGIRALIEGQKVDTLTYDVAVKMTNREIVAWRKARFQAQLELSIAQSGVEVPEVKPAPVKPRALEAATDELLGAVSRAWHEVNRAKRVVEQLLPPGTDEWQPARTELAHAAHLMIRGIADETGALDDLLVKRFGVTVTRPREGEYRTLAASLLVAINNATETQADADTNARAKQRHARLKWRGAPPKTLDAVIANARNGDRE